MYPCSWATRPASGRRPAGSPRFRSRRRWPISWNTGGRASPLRTLITGVGGFVGRHLARELAQDEREELNGTDHRLEGDWEPDEALRCHLKSHRPLDVTLFEQVRGCL